MRLNKFYLLFKINDLTFAGVSKPLLGFKGLEARVKPTTNMSRKCKSKSETTDDFEFPVI